MPSVSAVILQPGLSLSLKKKKKKKKTQTNKPQTRLYLSLLTHKNSFIIFQEKWKEMVRKDYYKVVQISTKLYKFFNILFHIHYFTHISTIDARMSTFFNIWKKRWELVDVWESKSIKMWQWVGEDCTIVSNGICYDGYKVATTKIVLSINFTNAKWWIYNCSN